MKTTFGRILVIGWLLILCSTAFAVSEQALKIVSASGRSMDLRFQMPPLQTKTITAKDGQYQSYTLEGASYTAQTGLPALPFFTATIAIPATGMVEYTLSNAQTGYLNSVRPVPAQESEDTKAADWSIDQNFYAGSAAYPTKAFSVSKPSILRDFRIISVNIYPLQWDAATGRMTMLETADIRLSFSEGRGENELVGFDGSYSPVFTTLYEQSISNFSLYRNDDIMPVPPKVLLVYGNSTDGVFISKLTDLVTWKRQKGYEVTAVSTATTGSSNAAIKAYIQTQYDNPDTRPDYIILLGDTNGSFAIPTWQESWSGYNGEGDYPYTKLAGTDELGDCFIGRISASDLSQLDVILAKIYLMEKNINVTMPQAGWLNRLLLVGDPAQSGVSTINTNKFIKELAKQVNPDYTYTEVYSTPFGSQMNAAINAGVGLMNYRGYLGMSGWSASGPFTNSNKLPHAVLITCGTGSFTGNSSTEAFIRQGTSANPLGACTAIGMATTGTHTGLNNSLTMGIFQSIYGYGARTMGEALLAGRLNIEAIYGISNASYAHRFAHWCNLMGDPTLEVYTSVPQTLVLNNPASIPSGTNQLELNVVDGEGTPVKYASVTVYNETAGIDASGFTDANGYVVLAIHNTLSGTLKITAAKHNYKAIQADINITPAGAVLINAFTFDDDNNGQSHGNGNFMLNAGETVESNIALRNSTTTIFTNLSATISTTNPNVNIITANAVYPNASAGTIVQNLTPFVFSLAVDAAATEDIRFVMTLTDGTSNWELPYHIIASNLQLTPASITVVNGANAVLDPGETAQLRVVLDNPTALAGSGISAELTSLSDMITVRDSIVIYGDIMPNAPATPLTDFEITGHPQLIPGMLIPMQLRIFNSAGFSQVLAFNLPIGTPSSTTPLGPDAYGYFIYDVTDVAYTDVPQYNWIEIAPALGGDGISLELSDEGVNGDEGDQSTTDKIAVISLPFPFGFYGTEYNQISVSVNGFIAMGVTENPEFRNYHLPGAGGPSPMIAPFWDDLCTNGGGQVYRHFDAEQHIFIIQYQNMKNGYNRTSEETFQVIFYDPAYYPSGLGDGSIKIQYKVFNNVDIGATGYSPGHGVYSTIGIKNQNGTVGLEYTYNNVYPTPAAPLDSETAIFITTIPVIHEAPYLVISETYMQDSNNNGLVEPTEEVELGIRLSNMGLNPALNALLTITENDPYVTMLCDTTSYPVIPGSGSAVNNNVLSFQVSADCPDEHSIVLNCHIAIADNFWDRQLSFTVQKPALDFMSYCINDYTANGNGTAEPGESFILAINLFNPTDLPVTDVSAAITTANPNVTINTPLAEFYTIPPHTAIQQAFSVSFNYAVPFNSYVPFNLNFSGTLIPPTTAQFNVGCGTSGMNLDFEQNNGSMMAVETDGWAWGTDNIAGAHSGTKVWGTVLNGEYPSGAFFELISPTAHLAANSRLEFYHWFSTEMNWDGGNVKISADNGLTWTIIYPETFYNGAEITALGEPGYTGTQLTWELARFNLSDYGNTNVKIKWTFASDDMTNGTGWYIDDVNFTGTSSGTGQINGVVALGSDDIPMTDVLVGTEIGIATHPDGEGNYAIYLSPDTYDLTASLPGHISAVFENATLNSTHPILSHDFYLGYLNPVSNITPSNQDGTIRLAWSAPLAPEFPIVDYLIYKRFNTGGFELLTQTAETIVMEPLTEIGQYQYYVIVNYGVGESVPSDTLTIRYPEVANPDDPSVPMVTALLGNYPNPFNPTTSVAFALSKAGNVSLHIYNLKGQLVKTLVKGNLPAGRHNLIWNGKDNHGKNVSSGMYLYRLETAGYTKTMKAMLLK